MQNNTNLRQKIAVIGAANLDIVANINQEFNNNQHRGNIKFLPGGKGFRTALKLSKLGLKSYFLSAIGDNFQAFIFEKELNKQSVSHKIIIDSAAGNNIVFIASQPNNNETSIVDEELFKYDIANNEIDLALKNASILVITFEMSQNNIRYAIEQANKKQITVFAVTCSIIETNRVDLTGLKINYIIGNYDDFKALQNKYQQKYLNDLAKSFSANLIMIKNSLSCTIIAQSMQKTIKLCDLQIDPLNMLGYKDRFLAFFIQQLLLQQNVLLAATKSLQQINTSIENYDEKAESFKNTINNLTVNSKIDSLTGIMNRDSFYEAVAKLDHFEKIYIALLDIDFFKSINDTYGHSTGDLVIKHIVNKIQSVIGNDAVFARYGGEEFAIIAKLEHNYAENFFNSIVNTVKKNKFTIDKNDIEITISIGYCLYTGNLKTDINNADTALYSAKNNGRNNAKFYDNQKTTFN